MQSENKGKHSVASVMVGIVAVILTLAVCTCVLIFLTNGVIEVDTDSSTVTSNFERTSVTTVIEQIHDKEETPPAEDTTGETPEPEPRSNKVAFFGDSISTFTGVTTFNNFFPAGDVITQDQTWWQQVVVRSGMVFGGNSSSSGSCVTNRKDYSGQSDERINALPEDVSVVYVFMGMNDYWDSVDVSDFTSSYIAMLNKIKVRCPDAELRCLTLYKTSFDTNARIVNYNKAITDAAGGIGASIIDLSVLNMIDDTLTQETDVHVHPTAKGMSLIADVVMGSYVPPTPVTPTPTPKPEPEPEPEPPLPGIPEPTPAPEPTPDPGDIRSKIAADIASGLYTEADIRAVVNVLGHEAYSTSYSGCVACASVIRNRKDDSRFPDTYVGVCNSGMGSKAIYDNADCPENYLKAAQFIMSGGESNVGLAKYWFCKTAGYPLWAEPDCSGFANVGMNIFYNEWGEVHTSLGLPASGNYILICTADGDYKYPDGTKYP